MDGPGSPVEREAALERPLRILVEAPSAYSLSVREALDMPGCEVMRCGGPLSGNDCPVCRGEPCDAVSDADVVVANLAWDSAENSQVLRGLRALHPGVPLVVLTWPADAVRHGDLLEGCRVVTFPWTRRKLEAAIVAAMRPAARPGTPA